MAAGVDVCCVVIVAVIAKDVVCAAGGVDAGDVVDAAVAVVDVDVCVAGSVDADAVAVAIVAAAVVAEDLSVLLVVLMSVVLLTLL